MKPKAQSQEPKRFLDYIVDLIQGGVLGLFSWIPFSSYQNLRNTMDLKRENQEKKGFSEQIKENLKRKWAFWIGLIIGAIFFFSINVPVLLDNYKTAIYGGLIAFILPSLAFEIYSLVRIRNASKRHWINAGIIFGCTFLVSFLLFCFVRVQGINFLSLPSYGFAFLLFFLGAFLTEFCGIGYGTVFFLFHYYLTYSQGAYFLALLQNVKAYLPLIVLSIIAALCGTLISQFTKERLPHAEFKNIEIEKKSLSINIYFVGIILILSFLLKPPYLTDITTDLAQRITLWTTIIGAFVISLALTIDGYIPKKDKKHAIR